MHEENWELSSRYEVRMFSLIQWWIVALKILSGYTQSIFLAENYGVSSVMRNSRYRLTRSSRIF